MSEPFLSVGAYLQVATFQINPTIGLNGFAINGVIDANAGITGQVVVSPQLSLGFEPSVPVTYYTGTSLPPGTPGISGSVVHAINGDTTVISGGLGVSSYLEIGLTMEFNAAGLAWFNSIFETGPADPDAPGLPEGVPASVDVGLHSTTYYYTDPNLGFRAALTVVTDQDTGIRTPVSVTVISAGAGATGTLGLLEGNVYAPGAVGVGQEMNGLDQIAHENHVRGTQVSINPNGFSFDNPAGDGDPTNDNDWRHPDTGPVQHGSGGGVGSSVGPGPGLPAPIGYSVTSPTGWNSPGVNDPSPLDMTGPGYWNDDDDSSSGGGSQNGGSAGGGHGTNSSTRGGNTSGSTSSSGSTYGDPNAGGVSTSSGGTNRSTSNNSTRSSSSSNKSDKKKPIILDLDGSGISVTELSQSTHFLDGGDGLEHRTAWAGSGDGVLFFDADGSGTISEQREYVFTEWDPTAGSDLDALRSYFDTNGDGKLTSADDDWADFKVQVVKDDGTTEVKTLDELGITEIDLAGDAANIELPDGSVITGQTTFTMNGQTYTVAEMSLATDGRGYRLEEVETTDGSGNTVRDITGYNATGEVAWVIHVVAAPDGSNTVNSYDDDGNGVFDRVQVITVATVSGDEVRTVSNYTGSDETTGVLENQTVTTISEDVPNTGDRTETIERDSTGGGWFDQIEELITHTDGSMTITLTDLSYNGDTIQELVETVSANGLARTETYDLNGDGNPDLIRDHVITVNANGSRTEIVKTKNGDGTVRGEVTYVYDTDGVIDRIERDLDGDGVEDRVEDYSYTVNVDGSSTSTTIIENQNGGTVSSVTETLSADSLTSTKVIDADGDGDTDLTIVEDVTITSTGVHLTEVTATNADGSIRSMSKTRLDADRIGQKNLGGP